MTDASSGGRDFSRPVGEATEAQIWVFFTLDGLKLAYWFIPTSMVLTVSCCGIYYLSHSMCSHVILFIQSPRTQNLRDNEPGSQGGLFSPSLTTTISHFCKLTSGALVPGAPEPKPEKAPTPSWPRAPLSREDIDRGRISAGAGIGSAGVLRAERFPLSAACVCVHMPVLGLVFFFLLEPVGSILCANCAELSLFSTSSKWEQVLGPACLRWSGSVLSQRWYFYFLILQLALRHL